MEKKLMWMLALFPFSLLILQKRPPSNFKCFASKTGEQQLLIVYRAHDKTIGARFCAHDVGKASGPASRGSRLQAPYEAI